jgi:thiamine biosynthesis lipoprotein
MDIDDSMSAFKPDSEVSHINANAGVDFVPVSGDTMELLKRSLFFSEASEGAFDITAAPLVDLWGIGKKQRYIPEADSILKAKALVGYQDLILDEANGRAMLARRGMSINLGGIAKGYAADEVKRILKEHGIRNALVNLGGNIWAMGRKYGSLPWRVGVQDPMEPTGVSMGEVLIEDETTVTSGSYEQYFDQGGVRYHHILDPRSGSPASAGLLSVTAVGACSMDMDALTTAVFVLGIEKGTRLLQRLNAQAVFIDTDRNVYVTKGLKEKFTLSGRETARHERSA